MGDQMLTSPAEAKLIIAMVKIQARLQNITASGIIAIACLGAVLLLSHALVVMLPALPIETNALGIYSARRAPIIASPGRRDAMCFRRVLALPAIHSGPRPRPSRRAPLYDPKNKPEKKPTVSA